MVFYIVIWFQCLEYYTAIVEYRPVFMPPTLKKWGDILVSACPYVCTYSCSRYRLETSCMDSSWKNSRRIFLVFPELSPLVKLRPFDKPEDQWSCKRSPDYFPGITTTVKREKGLTSIFRCSRAANSVVPHQI